MPMMTKYGTPAQQEPAKNTKIKAKDDFYVLQRKKSPLNDKVFFMRDADGGITVIWSGDDLEVKSFGSAKERHAAFVRTPKTKRKVASSRKFTNK
jgi:hypothetical protein